MVTRAMNGSLQHQKTKHEANSVGCERVFIMTNVDESRPGLLHHLWKSTLISGLLAVVLGVLVLVWPGKSIIVAAVFLGIYLVVSGVAQVIFAFSLPVSAASRILLFVSGAASLVLAVLAFRHFGEGYAILLLAIWIGVGFVFRGVATSVAAVSDPHLPGRGWVIFIGVMEIISSFGIRSDQKKLNEFKARAAA